VAETTTGLSLKTPQIHITAGEHRVTGGVHPALRRARSTI
jgi:hypothetical protein